MLSIIVVCSLGLGSSFIIESNIKKYLNKKDIKYKIMRSDITTAEFYDADVFVCSEDINFNLRKKAYKIELSDILDEKEVCYKMDEFLVNKGE